MDISLVKNNGKLNLANMIYSRFTLEDILKDTLKFINDNPKEIVALWIRPQPASGIFGNLKLYDPVTTADIDKVIENILGKSGKILTENDVKRPIKDYGGLYIVGESKYAPKSMQVYDTFNVVNDGDALTTVNNIAKWW